MAPYASPSITVAGSLRSLTQAGLGVAVLEVGSVTFPPDVPPPVITT